MTTIPTSPRIIGLAVLTSLAQVIGLVVVIAADGPVALSVAAATAGFAAIVAWLLPVGPERLWIRRVKLIAALCGVGLILFAITKSSGM